MFMDDPGVSEKLSGCSVGIAGAGGLGSNAAMALARSGVGRLVIVDFDRVEASNLNRQYFFLDQVGEYKVEALMENIRRATRDCFVEIMNKKLEKGSMHEPFVDVDVVVEALDDARTKADFIEDIMVNLPGKPLVAASGVAGIGGSERITVERFGDLRIVEDHQALSSDEDVLLSPKVGVFAHHQANLVLEILLGGGK
ncbi:MAG: sulfur carrier protein ThiS adenylyltransferase ThiF [Candidatus Thermoplasmatota archaeon]|nr:sulfur carrier protein ThiS adenylyltransferase ThiF [Candidatus Thermoplasmatota archaeon]